MDKSKDVVVRAREAYDAAANRANAAWIEHIKVLCGVQQANGAFERYAAAQEERRAAWIGYCEVMGISNAEAMQ